MIKPVSGIGIPDPVLAKPPQAIDTMKTTRSKTLKTNKPILFAFFMPIFFKFLNIISPFTKYLTKLAFINDFFDTLPKDVTTVKHATKIIGRHFLNDLVVFIIILDIIIYLDNNCIFFNKENAV